MTEEHKEAHHTFGSHHESSDKKEQKSAMYWSLGIGAAGLVVTVLLIGGQQKKPTQQPQYELVHGSTDFIPNPTDISIGSNAAPLFWPALPTSGTPTKPKTHHHGDKDDKKKKTEKHHDHNTPNDHKKYGKSPVGASHGHSVSSHNVHNPKTHEPGHGSQHTKGKANG